MRSLLSFAAGLGLLAGPALAGSSPASGQYEALTLAVTGGIVSGAFSEARAGNGTADAPQFSCTFLLRGRLEGGRALIETWYPGGRAIPGELAFSGGRVPLALRENQDGCPMVVGDMVGRPVEQDLTRAGGSWIGVALVAARRAVFHPAPGTPTPRAPYVVRSDVVAVLERRGGWVRASYLGENRPVTGWLRAADLASDTPPGRP